MASLQPELKSEASFRYALVCAKTTIANINAILEHARVLYLQEKNKPAPAYLISSETYRRFNQSSLHHSPEESLAQELANYGPGSKSAPLSVLHGLPAKNDFYIFR